jgi:Arc/MetJ-type ribon-helix-helix transcriptional regulator
MQLNVPPDLETLINKRLSSGGYTNAEDVLRRALEAQDAEESWSDDRITPDRVLALGAGNQS